MSVALLALALLACSAQAQYVMPSGNTQVGQSCGEANMIPWPVPGNYKDYYMCVSGQVVQMSCPGSSLFVATDPNVFGCIPMGSITCSYQQNGNYWDNNNNNNYPWWNNNNNNNNNYPWWDNNNNNNNNYPWWDNNNNNNNNNYPWWLNNNNNNQWWNGNNGYEPINYPNNGYYPNNGFNNGYYPYSESANSGNGPVGAVTDGKVIISPVKK